MKTNVGGIDKILRIGAGVALVAWAALGGPVWAWRGFPMRAATKSSIYRREVRDAAFVGPRAGDRAEPVVDADHESGGRDVQPPPLC